MSVQFRFLGGLFFDNFKDESVNYSRKAVDFQKVDLTFNDFSKSFFIPATPINNQIFKHYYDPTVVDSFNPFSENKAEMWVNGELYSNGQITLIDIDVRDGVPEQYQIQFYSETIDLKSALGDKGIDQLGWSGLDHSATATNILTYIQGGAVVPGTSLRYVMGSVENLWTWEGFTGEGVREIKSNKDGILNTEVRPAIPVSEIVSKIFTSAGYDVNISFENDDYYTKLYMWIHNGKSFIRDFAQVASAFATLSENVNDVVRRVTYPNEKVNELKMWSTINNECIISNAAAIDYTLTVMFSLRAVYSNAAPEWRYVLNGTPSAWNTINDGTPVNVVLNNLSSGDVIYIETADNGVNGSGFVIGSRNIKIENTDPSALDYFNTNSYFPTMKCTEFLRGVLVTFNAIMYWDPENTEFVIKGREQWYQDGNTIDITKNIDTSKSKIKPPTFYKEYSFSFEEGKDFRNEQFKEVNNRVYGTSSYDTQLTTGDTYQNKNPFTPTIWAELVQQTPNGSITFESDVASNQTVDASFSRIDPGVRLMYYNGSKTASGNFKVVDYTDTSAGAANTYNFFISALVSEGNLNLAYNTQLDFQASGGVELDKNLFTEFYQNYVESIYNQNVRRLNISAYIPYNKLKTIQVNDTIVINNVSYFIDGFTVDLTTNKATFDLITKV